MPLGVIGGTFDPIHQGHLDVARAAKRAFDLNEVWFVPAGTPPHRSSPMASPAHRFAMTALALEGEEGLLVSDIEMDAPGPSYTIDTLDRLAGRGIDVASLFLVLGADAFRDIRLWKGFPAVLD